MKKIVVPDASVILKWGFRSPGEGDRDKAAQVLDAWLDGKLELLVPRLWAFEVGNVLALKNPSHAAALMDVLLGYGMAEAETSPELCRAAIGLAKAYRATFYDAVYHAVALVHGGLFVTADEAYHRKAAEKGKVILLRDWSPGL